MFGITKIGQNLHPKKCEKEIILLVNYHELEMIHGQ